MTDRLLKFVSVERAAPEKRDPADRRADFDEIYHDFRPEPAAEQAARCSQCGIPYCQVHCPLANNIPDWLMLAANGRMAEAYAVAAATNALSASPLSAMGLPSKVVATAVEAPGMPSMIDEMAPPYMAP